MGSELPGKDVEDLFSNPTAFGERRESKVVWVDFAETYTKAKQNKSTNPKSQVKKIKYYQKKKKSQIDCEL
jgi:hypothetical protein